MDARDYNLCLSADHNDVVIARNHGLGFFDNRTVTGEFLWVCEQLGYVKERTCKPEIENHGDLILTRYPCCGYELKVYRYSPYPEEAFNNCPNCGAKAVK